MHTIKDLEDHFGWSYMQARKRVLWIKDHFSAEVKGGGNQAYQVTDNGLEILDRINQLEDQKEDLNVAFDQVKKELENRGSKGNKQDVNRAKRGTNGTDRKYVDLLEERVRELKEDKKRLQVKVDQLEERLLPPPQESRRGFLEKFFDLLRA